MTAPSYASAAASAATSMNGNHRSTIRDLYTPAPTSWTLWGALSLLEPHSQHVYLMTHEYLQNWLRWAYHQPVPPNEQDRLRQAIKLAAEAHGLDLLYPNYQDPGPVDNRAMSVPGTHPLLLRPEVKVRDIFSPTSSRSIRLANSVASGLGAADMNGDGGKVEIVCCPVPERFYELLRSVHGVVCEDNVSLSFQPEHLDTSIIIHHHRWVEEERDANWRPRPIEFRRPVLAVTASEQSIGNRGPMSPATKLLVHHANEPSNTIPTVEAFPLKLVYRTAVNATAQGFVLVSKASKVVDVIPALRKAVAPDKSSSCVRFWTKMDSGATSRGDGYELVHLDKLDGRPLVEKDLEPSKMTMGEWVRRHSCNKTESLDILVETRVNPDANWARQALEHENRLQVGDFVDAQDTAGKWYEAVVRDITEDTVTVHYAGWATKWNGVVPRRCGGKEVEGVSRAVNPPAPLWSHTSRWRERIHVGQLVEVRESASPADRPKWYKGMVRKVGGETDPLREMPGGADLEAMEIDSDSINGDKRSLLILNRSQQILVEVPQEQFNSVSTLAPADSTAEYTPRPPFIRWVNLFGEEICAMGTHLVEVKGTTEGPVTVDYDFDSSRGPPVEIMKTFNNLHGAGFVRESMRGVPPAPGSVGLHNLGNSCFLNSIVQCLNHIEALTTYFLNGSYAHEINRNNPLGSGGRVAIAYGSLLKDMWSGEYSIMAPRLLKQTVGSFAPQFNNLYQHDSHEFCSFLMDGLHEDLNRVLKKPYVEELEGFGMRDNDAAIESWKKHLLRHDSIIVDHCQGMHRSHLTCPICGRESIKFDVYSSISLPLVNEKGRQSIPLSDCLGAFTEGEQLDEHNAWYCPSCQKHVCALKMIALWSVPDILILHLKRFTFDHCDRSGDVVRHKVEKKVVFPIDQLDMTDYILGPIDEDAPPVYKLFGVSEHSGATANSGHYTATVRNSQDGKWYRYNDSHVGSTSGDASVTGGAYVLFYQRIKGSSRWAGMEKAIAQKLGQPVVDEDGFTPVKSKKKKGKHARR